MEREKIKNALSNSDLKTLLKIVKCYNKDNGLAPIYENDEASIKELRDCGYTVDEIQIQDFAFLTPNRYGGVSGQNELNIDIDTELVPYVEANYTTYEKDLHIDDDRTLFDLNWLKENWTKAIGHENRYLNLMRIADKVNKEDTDFAEKLYGIAKQYDNEPKRYTYNWAKEEFKKSFEENVPDKESEISELEKRSMKEEAKHAYSEVYNKKADKFKDLPTSWKEILNPLIESGRKESFKKELMKLKGETGESKETLEDLKRGFERVFGFSASEENIKNFGDKHEEDGYQLLECIKATFKAFKEGKLDYDRVIRFFEQVKAYPSRFLMLSEGWYEEPLSEEEKEKREFNSRQREIEADLDVEEDDQNLQKLKNDIAEDLKLLMSSGPEDIKQYWKNHHNANLNLYRKGEFDKITYLKNLKSLMSFCLSKAGLKSNRSEKSEKSFKDMEKYVLQELHLDFIKDAIEKIKATKTETEYEHLIKKLDSALRNSNLSIDDLSNLSDDQCYDFFENIISQNKQAHHYKNMIEEIKKESEN